MSTITLQSEREIKDTDGNVLFSASIYDLSLIVGSVMASHAKPLDPAIPSPTRLETFAEIARIINEQFQPSKPLTAGAAMNLTDVVEREMIELKKTERSNRPMSQESNEVVSRMFAPNLKLEPMTPLTPHTPSPSST